MRGARHRAWIVTPIWQNLLFSVNGTPGPVRATSLSKVTLKWCPSSLIVGPAVPWGHPLPP